MTLARDGDTGRGITEQPSGSPPQLQHLQESLESFYRLEPAPPIADFLLQGRPPGGEELLIVEDQDLYLALVLDSSIPPQLEADYLEHRNMSEFCLAVEGISHYLFVIFCARQERSVSMLEIELQGEVDKYVACMLLARRAPDLPSEEVRRLLYDRFRLLDGLDHSSQLRYRLANALARRYAMELEHRFIRRLAVAAMVVELRHFYRVGYARKRELIGGR
jgi:hypothetical protein